MEHQGSDHRNEVVSLQEWIITILIAAIPIVNIVMFFIWAFGENTKTSKANWARASLIWIAVIFVAYLLFVMALYWTVTESP